VNVDAQSVGGSAQYSPDVVRSTEPQSSAIVQSSGKGLGDQPAAAPARGDLRRTVEEFASIDHVHELRMREAHGLSTGRRKWSKCLRQLTRSQSMEALEQTPVPTQWKEEILGVRQDLWPFTKDDTNEDVLIDDDHPLDVR
jgi:hypothetical protein